MPGEQLNRDRWRRYWDKASVSYDRQMQFYDRVLLGDSRAWACAQATGHTLEVAVGTGLRTECPTPDRLPPGSQNRTRTRPCEAARTCFESLRCENLCGRYWDRTSDLLGVNEALSR